jgi:hypothetical protein
MWLNAVSELWQAAIFPLGFLVFSVAMILGLMQINIGCNRRQMIVVCFCLAVMCIGFAITGEVGWHTSRDGLARTVTRLAFTVVIVLIGYNVVRKMIILHSNYKDK